jgi:hypothetical protein
MRRRAARVTLFLLIAAAMAGAGYIVYQQELAGAPHREDARALDALSIRALVAVADLRTAQQALVAPGQNADFWGQKLAEARTRLGRDLEDLHDVVQSPAALHDLDAAAAALTSFAEAQADASRAVRREAHAEAAAIIFGPGLEATSVLAARVQSAHAAEAGHRQQADTDAWLRFAALPAALAGLALLLTLFLVPTPRPASREPDVVIAAADGGVDEHRQDAPAAELPLNPSDQPAPAAEAATLAESAPSQAEVTLIRDRRKAPELRAAADLCTDFARLLDPQELPALLDRAARLLDAQGLIVWIVDPAGHELRPTLAHGYSAQTLSRIPAIASDDDNATAAAFRHADLQTVKTNGMSPGAIVVPLLTPQGCIGAMAAEVRHGREASESARALARIVAAQIATLVSVVPPDQQAATPTQQAAG